MRNVRASLESRIFVLVVGLLFMLLSAVGYLQIVGQQANLADDKISEYQGMSSMLALTYTPLARENNLSLYHEFTTRFMKADPDIAYVRISDSRGRVLFAHARNAHTHDSPNLVGGKITGFVEQLTPRDKRECSTFSVPAMVKPGERGAITVGFRPRSMNAALESMRAALLSTFALTLLAGLLGAILVAKAVTSPLRRLTEAAHSVADGDLDVSVSISSNDEVGELAETFNRMVVALKENRDMLIERANTDSVTGLCNHRYFQDRLRSELKRAERYQRPFAVLMLDIDDFKALNDTHGHLAGDAVLQALAHVLVSCTRTDVDQVARYGGEEFGAILPETNAADAAVVAERMRSSVEEHPFTGKDGEQIRMTISAGVAEYPVHSAEPEGLIMAADLALYQSKSMGKNRCTVFSTDTREHRNRDPYKLYLLLNATDAGTIEAIAAAVDAKGQRSPAFSKAIVNHAVAVAQELGLSEEEQNDVRIASLLHDIGKLGISDAILNKKGTLTDDEREMMKTHPALGYAIVRKSPHLKSMVPGILYHHERWDGTGYPEGLKGEGIPLIARIIAVVDAYHAMITKRSHTQSLTPDEAKAELRRGAGTQFDPRIVDVFLRILEREDSADQAA